ncbi:hypothetical protein C8R48DRAFT_761382 [Suillus tomentosus]|nr:hypothetical protein C8R48DRAFT_761382 [Suillus tomentosus]
MVLQMALQCMTGCKQHYNTRSRILVWHHNQSQIVPQAFDNSLNGLMPRLRVVTDILKPNEVTVELLLPAPSTLLTPQDTYPNNLSTASLLKLFLGTLFNLPMLLNVNKTRKTTRNLGTLEWHGEIKEAQTAHKEIRGSLEYLKLNEYRDQLKIWNEKPTALMPPSGKGQ